MAPKWRYIMLALILLLPAAVAFVSEDVATAPNSLQLVCDIDSVNTSLSNSSIVVPVFLTNVTDSVAGFTLWINISDPDLVKFKIDSTVAGVHYAKIDTVGTLTRGWQFLTARVLDDNGGVLKISGAADQPGPPLKKPIPPGSGTLLKIYLQTNGSLGDSICDSVHVQLLINKGQTLFSNPKADLIGCVYHWEYDTTHGACAHFTGQTCDAWFDTTIDSINVCVIDTTRLVLLNGATGFICCDCGDANHDGQKNISDAVFLIQYIFAGGAAPNPICQGDANGDTFVNISDAVFLIQYIFAGGIAPHCH